MVLLVFKIYLKHFLIMQNESLNLNFLELKFEFLILEIEF